MQGHFFYTLGKFIYPLRWFIVVFWLLVLLASLPFLPNIISPFKTTGFIDETSQSAKAEEYINKKLDYNTANKFLIIYRSPTLLATNPQFIQKIKQSLEDLKDFPIKHEILMPEDNKSQIAKDKHTAYVVVMVKSSEPLKDRLLTQFEKAIKKPKGMTVELGGEAVFVKDVNKQTQTDLYRADLVAAPVAIVTLLFVFGSVVAALLPIVLGGGAALIILTMLFFLGYIYTLSIFTLNIALLLGLCLSLDYSLFIISRFRDELHHDVPVSEAIAVTEETAGKAVFFSGLAVLVSLSALFLFPINILFSVAMGGIVAVIVAVLTAIVLLPAILSILNRRINLLSVRFHRKGKKRASFWYWLATKIVKRPLLFFFPVLLFLLMLGYPFLSAKFGVSDHRILPETSEHRRFFDTYAKKFNIESLNPILVLIQTPHSYILSKTNLDNLYDLAQRLKKDPAIDNVNSIVTTDSKLTKNQYYHLYNDNKDSRSKSLKQLLATTTSYSFTVMNIISKYPINSPETQELIATLRDMSVAKGMEIELTGTPVINKEVLESISRILPLAILWIIIFTYLILLVLLRSLFLPVKAILMNLLSLCACYGALVLVFQEGYLSQWLHFEPQGMLDISLLVIIFCALFGFSMDYEVFLLTRIKECYEENRVNSNSIVFGIEKSSRIITSAALIVIVICGSFLVAEVLMVKAFGLGIAVAIFVDAFLIRTLLVPSTMALLQSWNWYLPKWLDRLLPRL
ncbi:Membrane protein YdfJ [Legionella clemsonensis]|uniref:Membrane protein YdfJ n=2 Tax=Legionella clemsonensis TaxID=1867846 RepID=A0A222P3B2_9GAMM|nr:MMPL family transporter [Legionella clemsonensis]ASQ46329.1 Membrane protein YdfJ [Legionella clemsonensis]